MAIRVVRRLDANKEEEARLRIKQRDYTIPVRLNQLPPSNLIACYLKPATSDSSRTNRKSNKQQQQQQQQQHQHQLYKLELRQSTTNKMHERVKATAADCSSNNSLMCASNEKAAANCQPSRAKAISTTSNHFIHPYHHHPHHQHHHHHHHHHHSSLISNLKASSGRREKIGCRRPLSLASLMVIAGVIVTLTATTICNCDTQKRPNGESGSVSSGNGMQNQATGSVHGAEKARARDFKKDSKVKDNNSAAAAAAAALRKEHLLSYLSENIERQHFKMSKPVKALANGLHHHHQRPSKFDSGGDDLSYDSSEISSSYALSSPAYHQHHKSSSSSSSSSVNQSTTKAIEKVDEGLRQILRMHEMANVQQAHNRPMASIEQQHSNIAPLGSSLFASSSAESSTNSATTTAASGFASRLRELSRAPVRVASNIIKPNKVVSHMLSYITPLIKLSNHQQLFDQRSSLLNSTSSLFGGFHTFGGRSNNQLSLAKSVLNSFSDEPSIAAAAATTTTTTKKEPTFKSFVTAAPQTSFLVKPDSYEKYLPTSTRHHFHSITQPTTLLDSFGDALLKSALIKPNLSPKDLDVSDSSSSLSSASLSDSSNSGSSSSNGEASSQSGLESSVGLNEDQRASKVLGPAGTWLKENANKIAQNYLQDSFRGLLTLSQLPILQATPISTAPSVLEKGGRRQKKPNKSSGSATTSSATGNPLSQINRNRALDELYRYAYILGTGVRRKRDPLKALSSSSNAVANTFATSSKKLGVFSQRSRNQLIQPPNQNQLLNYAKGLKTLLSAGGAKPRGVMWDMATDPSLAVTVFHLLERASVALPLGFLLMPFIKMIHNPLSGVNFQGLLPSRALHRSVDYEELAKRLDVVDKMLSRALRPTHRESFIGKR